MFIQPWYMHSVPKATWVIQAKSVPFRFWWQIFQNLLWMGKGSLKTFSNQQIYYSDDKSTLIFLIKPKLLNILRISSFSMSQCNGAKILILVEKIGFINEKTCKKHTIPFLA